MKLALISSIYALNAQCVTERTAICQMEGGVSGTLNIIELMCGSEKEVQVTGTLNCLSEDEGLCNEGLHGFHVHQKGTIRNGAGEVDCGLTGSHFQVPGQVHSFPADPDRHFGALGNVQMTAKTVNVNVTDDVISLDPESDAFIGGRAFNLHALPDDFQGASGNAGPRVGCCRISDPVKAPVAAALTADEFDYANGSFIQIGSIATMLLAYLFI